MSKKIAAKDEIKDEIKDSAASDSKPITKIEVNQAELNGIATPAYKTALKQAVLSCPVTAASRELTDGTVALFKGIAPRNEIEAMLAGQMVACHNLSMEAITRAGWSEQSLQAQAQHADQANKLMRTFAVQTEALSKLRGDSKTVIVKHVTIAKGGQAVIGDVNQDNSHGKK